MTTSNVILNAYGLSFHFTDTFVCHSEKDPVAKMKELRAAYDAMVDTNHEALEVLLHTAYDTGYYNGKESSTLDD
jgi:hypothetical protein